MKVQRNIFIKIFLIISFTSQLISAQDQIGVAAAVNRNTTDLTIEQERKLVEAGYQIIQNHTIETDESGGRITVNLYKSGDISTSEANDFYMAEGIYLID